MELCERLRERQTDEQNSADDMRFAAYEGLSDEDIVLAAKAGDAFAEEYILGKYKNFVRIKTRYYYIIGGDREDTVQEGMIGLYKAVRDFVPDKISSFRAFAELCIKRQMITAVKTATRQKHIPLNSYVSLHKPVYDEESQRTYYEVLLENRSNPEEILIDNENYDTLQTSLGKALSGLELSVLELYLDGKSYSEISTELGKSAKTVDNALQRVKHKIAAVRHDENNGGK